MTAILHPSPLDVVLCHEIRLLLKSKGWYILPIRLGHPKQIHAVSANEDLFITVLGKEVSDE